MPTPDQWSEQDFESAKQLMASGKGSAEQRKQLENALNSYWTAKTGNLGIADDTPERVSRETKSSDPFAAYDAETKAMGGGESEFRPQQGQQPPPGKLETFGNSAINAMNLGMGDSLSAAEGINALGGDIGNLEQVKGQIASRREEGKKANPMSAFAGDMVGLGASPAMAALGPIGGAIGRGMGMVGRAGRVAEAVGSGAVQGAAGGAALAPDGAKMEGGAVGALTGSVLPGVMAAFSGDAGALGGKANELAARASGMDKADIKQVLLNKGSEGLRDIGARLDAHGIRTFEDAQRVNARAGEVIGNLSEQASSKVDLSDAGNALMKEADKLLAMRNPQANALGKVIYDQAEPLLGRWKMVKGDRVWVPDPHVSYAEAHETRRFMDELVQKAQEMGQKDTPLAKRLSRGANEIRAAMDDAAAQEGPEFHAAMRHANEAFSTSKQALEYLADQRAGDMAGSTPYTSAIGTLGINLLRNGKARARVLAGPVRKLSHVGATLPELAPMIGGVIGRYATPDEENQ